MKMLFLLILLVPFLAISQVDDQAPESSYLLYENELLNPIPTKMDEFREGLKEHNEEFHSEDPYGARVYYISSGANSGKYMSAMGPFPWSALDELQDDSKEHNEDWEENVQPYLLPQAHTSYWRFHPGMSTFSEDIEPDKLLVHYYDVRPFEEERMIKLLDMTGMVMKEKYPEVNYTTYTNIFPSDKEGKDLALVFFFDDYSWLGRDENFKDAYTDIHGSIGWEQFLTSWKEVKQGEESEIWIYQPELSGK
ncbi:hypothetical protein [Salinimicrobium terrae]|uniref:hypothetical protein n=1 Tax=Salinimicrobium terrae TaxID=470866 RepID=UPI0004232447|nr:hypothetical protein [Salinimicrobium terrae]